LKKLDRYLIGSVLKIFIITSLAGLALSLIIEFFERVDVFTASFNNFLLSTIYLCLKIPYYFNIMLPLVFLISMLIFFVLIIRGNEMITIRTSGISTLSLMKPLLGLASFFIISSFILAEWIIPITLEGSEYIYRVKIKKEESYVFLKNDRIWFKRDNIISNIDFFDNKKDTIKGLTVVELSNTFGITKRTDAETGVWNEGSWLFTNVIERTFDKRGVISKKTYSTMRDIIKEPPSIFKVAQKNPEEMSYGELSKYIKRLKRSGHDVRRYLVDLYNKIAFPFINLVMVFAALSMGLRYVKTKHVSQGILSGLSVGILYWFFHSISLSLGYSEIFPPLFAAWFSNLVFLSAGVIGIVSLRT